MKAIEPVRIGKRLVGPGHPAYIVAEIGINHNGDMALAREMIAAAQSAGACAVKFQNYRVEDFLADDTLTITYESAGRTITEPQRVLFERCLLSDADVKMLAAECAERGIDFHSTPTHAAGVDLLKACGVGVLKNGSDFLSHTPLVGAMARSGLPTVLSTGMARLADIDEAVRCYRENGGRELILLHCVSRYPAPAADLNLRRIGMLQDLFGVPAGFSDHSRGVTAATLAVAQGACWIEKHFTTDKNLPGPDHAFSCDVAELKEIVASVREAEQMLGDGQIGRSSSDEEANSRAFRLSCASARSLPAGHCLNADDIAFFRPGTGLPPSQAEVFVGRTLTKGIERGTILEFSFLR